MPIKLLFHRAIANLPPADTAILHDGRMISYGALNASANGAADWLRAGGVRAGDVVALNLSDAVLQICFTLGIVQIGACQATLDPFLPPAEFRNLTRRIGVSFFISDVPTGIWLSVCQRWWRRPFVCCHNGKTRGTRAASCGR